MNQPDVVAISFNTPGYNGFPIKCSGGSDGETTAIGTGGVGGYKDFSWNTGATSDHLTGLAAGTYTVSLRDANDCPAQGQVTITQPPQLQVSLSPSATYNGYPVSCWNKADGALQANATGGVSNYTYIWSTGSFASAATGLATGNYRVTVTDGNTCTASATIALTAPAPINFTINQLTALACANDQTASLEGRSVVNTIGTVNYQWSSGETSPSIINKGAGNYSLTVSDDQGCSTTKSMTINAPAAYTVSLAPTSNFNGSPIKCHGDNNGELMATVKDPAGTIMSGEYYLWTRDGVKLTEGVTVASIDQLVKGQYKVTITYNRVCQVEALFLLSEPDEITVNAQATTSYNGQPVSCYNATDANIRATAHGGTGSYFYQWDTGANTALLSNVGAGEYTVTVKDANQCESQTAITVANPDAVAASVLSVSDYSGFGISCKGAHDGSITAKGTGGTGHYTYRWSTGQTTASLTNLIAGTYNLMVSDNNGCQGTLQQILTEPALLIASVLDKKNISCYGGNNGEIEVTAQGGAGNYFFSKDNSTNWQTAQTFSMLTPGSYTLTTRDANNCVAATTTSLTQPSEIAITFVNVQQAFCNNPAGAARAVVTGGVGNYTYAWQDDQSTTLDTDDNLSNAKGGIYTLIVRDGNTCEMRSHVAITSTDGATSTYVSTPANCFDSADGTAIITITQGDGPFSIQWPDQQTTLAATQLRRGTYNVLITDAHQCTVVQPVEITAPDSLGLVLKTAMPPSCQGRCDGQIILAGAGGVGSYRYNWNGQSLPNQTQLCAGQYPVTIKDGHGCEFTQTLTLAQPEPLSINVVNQTLPTCKDKCDGALQIEGKGGNGVYSYAWAAGGTTNTIDKICPGSYTVTVTDQKRCTSSHTVTLDNVPPIPVDLGGGVTLCVGQTYTLRAGTNWSHINWTSDVGLASTAENITIKDPGSYWLKVTDSQGCVGQDTFLLQTSYDLLKTTFLLQDEAQVRDTVTMIDISWPLPEQIAWHYPPEMKVLQDKGDVLFGQFATTGTYEIGLDAYLGQCHDQLTKTIRIIDADDEQSGGRLGYEEYVVSLTMYPNPNSGTFEVDVTLAEVAPIALSVWHAPTWRLLDKTERSGKDSYRVAYQLKLSPGTYILRLDHSHGKKYVRFVVY
ncbi:SprB repeat-containing protein [Chryseolinea lacunae]|uniref:SprB repeat-containing protein n=1 Tax=Chryseolinea lacunae TaxID=2801331 RepID=A0ABS1KJY9_9BACT|nr:SprB repeat-containing protein [Chryseolinea lacunae]MBL0739670.1 SprB repeat-containing protein [Chryseolinea lacunae]